MEYLVHLRRDKKMAQILQEPLMSLKVKSNISLRLIASIISQQLSTKVADIIYHRFLDLFNGKEPTNRQILEIDVETYRSIGLSYAKASYVHNVARFCLDQKITDKMLLKLTDEQIINLLSQIKGVGKWTVQMLLIFCLGREDVFAIDDLVIQNAMIKIYKLDKSEKKIFLLKLEKISSKWAPYRSYGCIHLWKWKDNPPI